MARFSLRVFAALELVWILTEVLGYLGLALIGYSIVAHYEPKWQWLEHSAEFVSSLFALLGTLVTVISVYFPQAEARPFIYWLFLDDYHPLQ
jgi:hypothetical protein